MAPSYQISVELTNVVTFLEKLAVKIYDKSITYSDARQFRDDGTDGLVEEELSAIFGRGVVEQELRSEWKQLLAQPTNFNPKDPKLLFAGSRIEFRDDKTKVSQRAATEQSNQYLGTLITLSMLSYFHNRHGLATLISTSMQNRIAQNLVAANESGDPGVELVENSLKTHVIDGGDFNWSCYSKKVKDVLFRLPTYQFDISHTTFSPAVFLGAMDFLYMAQQWRTTYLITLSTLTGCIPLIIWSHFILGLSVLIKDINGETVSFPENPQGHTHVQVQIQIPKAAQSASDDDFDALLWPSCHPPVDSTICIHEIREEGLELYLSVVPDGDQQFENVINAEERHALRGYAHAYLSRVLNKVMITSNNRAVWGEIVSIAGGFALHISRSLVRDMDFDALKAPVYHSTRIIDSDEVGELFETTTDTLGAKNSSQGTKADYGCQVQQISLEAGNIVGSAKLLFDGLRVPMDTFESRAKDIKNYGLCNCIRNNNTIKKFLDSINLTDNLAELQERFINQVIHLAKLIVAFAHVVGIDIDDKAAEMGKMQLILKNNTDFLQYSAVDGIVRNPAVSVPVDPIESFQAVAGLLSTSYMQQEVDPSTYYRRRSPRICLCSDYGWNVGLDTFGEKDPSQVRPERIHVRRGTPADIKTGQRKFHILDGRGFATVEYPTEAFPPPVEGNRYQPRCVAKIKKARHYLVIEKNHFEVTLHFRVSTAEEWHRHTGVEEFEEVAGFRDMQECLWQTFSTPPCLHSNKLRIGQPEETNLGSDAAAVIGWHDPIETPVKRRILIYLTRGDKHIRWLAIKGAVSLRQHEDGERYRREVMVRTANCCEECALSHVASKEGNWVLIL